MFEKTYNFTIKKAVLNDQYLALLSDSNKVCLTPITNPSAEDLLLPADAEVLQFSLTKHFLIFLDTSNKLKLYHVEDKCFVMEHKGDSPIERIFPNKLGTRILFLQRNGELSLLSCTTETVNHVRLVVDRVDNILWDNENPNEFIIIHN